MSHQSYRLMFKFWLDIEKPEEEVIADKIKMLKDERQFTATIRDGINLITDLRQGSLEELFEQFPWVRLEMMEYFKSIGLIAPEAMPPVSEAAQTGAETPEIASQSSVSAAQAALEQERQEIVEMRAEMAAYEREMQEWTERREQQIAAQWEHIERERERLRAEQQQSQSEIAKKLDKLEEMLLEQGKRIDQSAPSGGVGLRGSGGGSSGGLKPLGAPTLAPPNFDDEDDEDLIQVKEDTTSGLQANLNFIKSILALDDL